MAYLNEPHNNGKTKEQIRENLYNRNFEPPKFHYDESVASY